MAKIQNYDTNRILIELDAENVFLHSKGNVIVSGVGGNLNLSNGGDVNYSFPFKTIVEPSYPTLSELVQAVRVWLDEYIDPPTQLTYSNVSLVNQYNNRAAISPLGLLKVCEIQFLVGGNFPNPTLLSNQWTETTVNGGSIVVGDGVATMSTNTTADGSASLKSTRKARFYPGFNNLFFSSVRLGDTGVENNIRRWGVFDSNDGFFFELHGTSISVVARKNGVDTKVGLSGFNGRNEFIKDDMYHQYEIHYRFGGAYFIQDQKLIHVLESNSSEPRISEASLPITHESVNINGSTTNAFIQTRGCSVSKFGNTSSEPYSYFVNAVNETRNLKIGVGTLRRVVNFDNSGLISIYDNTVGSGTLLATIDGIKVLGTIDLGVTFDIGLTYVSSGNPKMLFLWD